MTNEAKAAATKLFNKLNREGEKVATVGVGISAAGGEVLIAYFRDDPTILPEKIDGFLIIPSSADALKVVKQEA